MRTRHLLTVITLALLPLIAACNGTQTDSKPPRTHTEAKTPATPTEEDTPEPTYADLDESDFLVSVKTTHRQCFGSAGCNVTVEPDVTYIGDGTIDPDKTYDITYQIHGDESGPVIETMELSDTDSLSFHESMLSTASSYTKITIKITDVTETS